MTQTLEEGMKNQSKCIKIPMEIRPFDVGYRIVNKHGQALALKNGASIFALPSLAEKAIKKEFGKNDPAVRFYGTKTSRNRYPISTILITCLHF